MLYLNVDGLTNLAIADGTTCRFTRVVGGGMEALASELAERRGISLADARTLIAEVDLTLAHGERPAAPAQPQPDASATEQAEPQQSASADAHDVSSGDESVAAAEALARGARGAR